MKSDRVFQLFVPAVQVVSYVISQVEAYQLFFTGIISLVIFYMNEMILYLRIKFPGSSTGPANIMIYIDTAVVVLIHYVSLLKINMSYIWLAVFPFTALVFIGALCNELGRQSGSQRRDNGEASSSTGTSNGEKTTKEPEGLKATEVIPYWVLCLIGQYCRDGSLIVSQFLLFLSSMLGALTLMMVRLPAGVDSPGVAPASELLHKTSLVVLLVTVHTMAAEFLGEDVVLFCLPELVPVLLWFSVHLDRGSSIISVDKIKSHKSGLAVLGAVVAAAFAWLASTIDESAWLLICTKTLVSCGVSGLLIYYVVFMLCQWPGQADTATATLKEAVKLLQFWANVLLVAPNVLVVITSLALAAVRPGLHGPVVAAPAQEFSKVLQVAADLLPGIILLLALTAVRAGLHGAVVAAQAKFSNVLLVAAAELLVITSLALTAVRAGLHVPVVAAQAMFSKVLLLATVVLLVAAQALVAVRLHGLVDVKPAQSKWQ